MSLETFTLLDELPLQKEHTGFGSVKFESNPDHHLPAETSGKIFTSHLKIAYSVPTRLKKKMYKKYSIHSRLSIKVSILFFNNHFLENVTFKLSLKLFTYV